MMDSTLEVIQYRLAAHKRLLHSDLIPMVKAIYFVTLAKRLHDNVYNVLKIVPPTEKFQTNLIIMAID
jgi:hypothetical protein